MLVFIAGASSFLVPIGRARAVAVIMLSAIPLANLAIVLAEAGATKNTSVSLAISICLIRVGFSSIMTSV